MKSDNSSPVWLDVDPAVGHDSSETFNPTKYRNVELSFLVLDFVIFFFGSAFFAFCIIFLSKRKRY